MTWGRTLLTSFSGFSTKFVGKEKPVIHYPVFIQQEKTKAMLACISYSYFLNMPSPATAPEMLVGIS
jgi:hypothetical protein